MPNIVIISSSIRIKRASHRVALYFKQFLEDGDAASVSLLDLDHYNFPLFTERLSRTENPDKNILDFAAKVKAADGVIIVTPEYNGGYPASLKNVVDLLYNEWKRKPIAISTVSSGPFGGMNVITSIQYSLWKIGAWTVPALFPVVKVEESFDAKGLPSDKAGTDKRAKRFVDELFWCIEANRRMAS
ncbi:MAG TPA: FMN reductase [Bacteroidetes bacterium]|nr:FMN reductase [Bacteroidota bacterium]